MNEELAAIFKEAATSHTDNDDIQADERSRRSSSTIGGTLAGGGAGAAGGAYLGHRIGGGPGAALGAALGGLTGAGAGHELAKARDSDKKVRRRQSEEARERAQEHRKELYYMKSASSPSDYYHMGKVYLQTHALNDARDLARKALDKGRTFAGDVAGRGKRIAKAEADLLAEKTLHGNTMQTSAEALNRLKMHRNVAIGLGATGVVGTAGGAVALGRAANRRRANEQAYPSSEPKMAGALSNLVNRRAMAHEAELAAEQLRHAATTSQAKDLIAKATLHRNIAAGAAGAGVLGTAGVAGLALGAGNRRAKRREADAAATWADADHPGNKEAMQRRAYDAVVATTFR